MRKIIRLFTIVILMLCVSACTQNGCLSEEQPQNSAEELVLTVDTVSEVSEKTESDSAVNSSDSLPQESTSEVISSTETVSESQSDTAITESTEIPDATSETEPEGFPLELDGYDCAVAYVGYTEDEDVNSVRKCVEESLTAKKYPFISDIANDKIIHGGGGEIYCIIPADTDAKITVNSYDHGDELYSGDSSPILLCCNISDIMPSTVVSITSGENTVKFSPFISLRDGRLDIPDDLKILDFSEYEF